MEAPESRTPATTTPPKKTPRPVWITLAIVIGSCLLCIPCTGVLAAISIPSFINYVKRSKAAEAHAELGLLAEAVEASCRSNGHTTLTAGPLPVEPGSVKQVGDFEHDPGFVALGYAQPSPVYYSYSVRTEASGDYVIAAEGDLDQDGTRSRFEVRCTSACTCGRVTIQNELE